MNIKRSRLRGPRVSGSIAGQSKEERGAKVATQAAGLNVRDVQLRNQQKANKLATFSAAAQAAVSVNESIQKHLDQRELEKVEDQIWELEQQVNVAQNLDQVQGLRAAIEKNQGAVGVAVGKIGDAAYARKDAALKAGVQSVTGSKEYTLKRKAAIQAQQEAFHKLELGLARKELALVKEQDIRNFAGQAQNMGKAVAVTNDLSLVPRVFRGAERIESTQTLTPNEKERVMGDYRSQLHLGISTMIGSGKIALAEEYMNKTESILEVGQLRALKRELENAKKVTLPGEQKIDAKDTEDLVLEGGGTSNQMQRDHILAGTMAKDEKTKKYTVPTHDTTAWGIYFQYMPYAKDSRTDILGRMLRSEDHKGDAMRIAESLTDDPLVVPKLYKLFNKTISNIQRAAEKDPGAFAQRYYGKNPDELEAELVTGKYRGKIYSNEQLFQFEKMIYADPVRFDNFLAAKEPRAKEAFLNEMAGYSPLTYTVVAQPDIAKFYTKDLARIGKLYEDPTIRRMVRDYISDEKNLPDLSFWTTNKVFKNSAQYNSLREGIVYLAAGQALLQERDLESLSKENIKPLLDKAKVNATERVDGIKAYKKVREENEPVLDEDTGTWSMIEQAETDEQIVFMEGSSQPLLAIGANGKEVEIPVKEYAKRVQKVVNTAAAYVRELDPEKEGRLDMNYQIGEGSLKVIDPDTEEPIMIFTLDKNFGMTTRNELIRLAYSVMQRRNEMGLGRGSGYGKPLLLKDMYKTLGLFYGEDEKAADEELKAFYKKR